MALEYRSNAGRSVAWFALLVAAIALTVAWAAYNRSGKDLEDTAADAVQNTTQNVTDDTTDAGSAAQKATDATEKAVDTGPDGVDDGAQ